MSENGTEKTYYIGVDLGGTKILAGLFDSNLHLIARNKIRTKPERGFRAVVERIARCVLELVDDSDLSFDQVAGLGVGTPGSIAADGSVIFAGNLGWENVPFKKQLSELLKKTVVVENDCNAAAVGIYYKELQSKPTNMVGIFLGTGVGAGLILNRELYRGSFLIAGEIGHMVIDVHGEKCNCGNHGCFELMSSRPAIFKKIKAAIAGGEKSLLTEMADGNFEDLRSGDLLKAINKGDKCVERIVDEAAHYTGIAVANIINILAPDVVVLGGGIIDALEDRMMPTIEKVALQYAFPGVPTDFKVMASKLGDNAGVTGAAVLAKKRVTQGQAPV